MTFLEIARQWLPENEPAKYDASGLGYKRAKWNASRADFIDRCWPEILAVIGAAETPTTEPDTYALENALEALNQKAKGL